MPLFTCLTEIVKVEDAKANFEKGVFIARENIAPFAGSLLHIAYTDMTSRKELLSTYDQFQISRHNYNTCLYPR